MLGTFRGYRVFTACRTINQNVFMLDEHVNRLFQSASDLLMVIPHTQKELKAIIKTVLAKNKSANSKFFFDKK